MHLSKMHFNRVFSLAAISASALLTNASPFAEPLNETEIFGRALAGWGYATFYDDNACSVNPGIAVAIDNPGCLANEFGRNSIYIQPGTDMLVADAALVWSPGSACDCQVDCSIVNYNGGSDYCWNLNGHAGASSFRFVTNQECDANNC